MEYNGIQYRKSNGCRQPYQYLMEIWFGPHKFAGHPPCYAMKNPVILANRLQDWKIRK